MIVPAFDSRLETFTIALNACALPTFASQLVSQTSFGSDSFCNLVCGLFEFRIKGRRISGQDGAYSFLAFRIMARSVVADEAATVGTAHDGGTKANAVKLQTFGFSCTCIPCWRLRRGGWSQLGWEKVHALEDHAMYRGQIHGAA